MKRYRLGVAVAILATAVALASCSSSKKDDKSSSPAPGNPGSSSTAAQITCSSGSLKAEGSTAQTNAINAWIAAYQKQCTGAKINYNPTGSGAGVTGFNAGQDDFVGSDSALAADKGEFAAAAKRCASPAYDLPLVVGPIAVAYKLKGVDKLILTGEVTAKIFLGKITKWNDSEIASSTRASPCPRPPSRSCYRSDSSGTTQNFEKYLAATAPSVFTSNAGQGLLEGRLRRSGQGQVAGRRLGHRGDRRRDRLRRVLLRSGRRLQTAWIDNGAGPVELSKDTASAAAGAATVAPNGAGDLTLKHRLRDQGGGCLPDHPGHVRDRLHQVQRRRQGHVRQELPDLRGQRRPGRPWPVWATPRCRPTAGQGRGLGREIS